jgi:nucleoside-diphosphate-sugar epimerase
MNVLVTGSEGRIGRYLAGVLDGMGCRLRGFDTQAEPQAGAGPIDDRHVGDLRDLPAVRSAMGGMDAVVHLGAIPSDRDDGAAVMQTNVMGTWNVLQAAQENGVRRVVFFSSINAQGSVRTGRPPALLPIDDDYPHQPLTPYQLSKHLGEEICRSFSAHYGMITLCLRPVWVTHPGDYTAAGFGASAGSGADRFLAARQPDLWAYVDVRDVGDAVLRCLQIEGIVHDCFLLAADDTSAHVPTAALLAAHYAGVPWPSIAPPHYLAPNPFRSLVDCARAKVRLGWQPRHSWRDATGPGDHP